MIRTEFFVEGSYDIEIRNAEDKLRIDEMEQGKLGNPLIEFCLPIQELKQIVDGIGDDEIGLRLSYPSIDNYLELEINDESKGVADKVIMSTKLHLETFEA